MSLATIRAAMATLLTSGVSTATIFAYPPGNPALPCVVVGWPQEWQIATYQRGGPTYAIPVEALVAFAHDQSADADLMELLDAVVTALSSDPSLGNTCDDSAPLQVTNVGVVDIDGDRKALAATVVVSVLA